MQGGRERFCYPFTMGCSPGDLPAREPIRSGGISLQVRRLGRGPLLILVHGGPGLDHHLLLPLALRLASHHEVWLPDLPGHGEATSPPPGLRQMITKVGRFLAGLDAPVVCGHSLGAYFLREGLRHRLFEPQAAIFLCPPGPIRGREARTPASPFEDREALESLLQAELAAGRNGARRSTSLPPEVQQALVATALQPTDRWTRLLAEVVPVLRAAVPAFDPRCPVLVLGGAADPIVPPAAVAAVAAATRGAVHETLAGAGHFPWVADPARVASRIEAFLSALD